MELSSLVTTSAVITAVLAFSMQETLGNVLGGMVLQLEHSIRVGDWVRIEQVSGRVVEIALAPHRGPHPRPRDGDRAQRLADEEPLHR